MDRIVHKWGYEEVLVNNDKYCAKFLHLYKGCKCSYHYHPIKKETFIPYEGEILLNVKGSEFLLTEPVTINPNTPHSFYGVTDGIILEVSTPHSDEDVVKLKEASYVG